MFIVLVLVSATSMVGAETLQLTFDDAERSLRRPELHCFPLTHHWCAMQTATEVFQGYMASDAVTAVDFFAADAVLEMPYAGQIGLPLVYRGPEEIRGLFAMLAHAIPTWRFKNPEIHIATDDKVFAEFFIDEPTITPGRHFSQHIFALMVVRHGKIVRLRETLDLIASARAFLPNGVRDIPA